MVQPPPRTLTSFMKASMTDPTCPQSPLSFPRTQIECCELVGVRLSGLLWSHVALLSPQLHRELLESMGWVSGFFHTPKALYGAPLGRERPSKGCCSALAVMFLPEYWTPGPMKPQLKLHKKLVGYKMQTYSIVSGPSFCYLSGHFQKAFLHFTV